MNKIEINGLIPEIEYKRARVKADAIDIALLVIVIISLLVLSKFIKENDQLLKDMAITEGYYNELLSNYDNLKFDYEALTVKYNELDSDYEYAVNYIRAKEKFFGEE